MLGLKVEDVIVLEDKPVMAVEEDDDELVEDEEAKTAADEKPITLEDEELPETEWTAEVVFDDSETAQQPLGHDEL